MKNFMLPKIMSPIKLVMLAIGKHMLALSYMTYQKQIMYIACLYALYKMEK